MARRCLTKKRKMDNIQLRLSVELRQTLVQAAEQLGYSSMSKFAKDMICEGVEKRGLGALFQDLSEPGRHELSARCVSHPEHGWDA